jgi:hypothetical protein
MKITTLFMVLFGISSAYTQDWEKRHQFAKSYFGVSNYIITSLSSGNYLTSSNQIATFEKSGFISPAVNIGATHFWGHADFYVSINTTDIKFQEDSLNNSYRLGTFTGLRIYPLASKSNNIRPYLGYKFSPFRYRQNNLDGATFKHTSVKSVLDVGLGIQLPNFYFTLEYGRMLNPEFETYLSRDIQSTDLFPKNLFQVGLNFMIETTKSASTEINHSLNKKFSASNQYGLFFAAGPSSSFPIGTSSYVQDLYPFLDDKSFPIIFPDIALGYHFTKPDIIAAFSMRPINQKRSAYDYEHQLSRQSIILETYKFLADYHGFVPYVGLGMGYEKLEFTETNRDPVKKNQLSPAVVFGWDIRPSVKGDWWILRTNLRYYPFLKLHIENKSLSLQHMEFNFIQFVIYPQRSKIAKNKLAQ